MRCGWNRFGRLGLFSSPRTSRDSRATELGAFPRRRCSLCPLTLLLTTSMDRTLSLTFLGTGCSSANPSTNCLLKPDERCPACADAFKHPETSPNVRYNTSAVVQTSHSCEQGSK
jgi:hypothetical protein